MKMVYRYWGFDNEFRGPREYARSPTHTAQTKQNAFKGAYLLSKKWSDVMIYDESTKQKYVVFEEVSEDYGTWVFQNRRYPKKATILFNKSDKTRHILKSDGTLDKEFLN